MATTAFRADPSNTTPIKHVVVIFQENVSFDHYFGTYPKAANPSDEGVPRQGGHGRRQRPQQRAAGLEPEHLQPEAARPHRALDLRPGSRLHARAAGVRSRPDGQVRPVHQHRKLKLTGKPGLVMDYYDGNTVTGLWNYAQNFSMSDNSYDMTFGPSTPGALNLVSGQTHGATPAASDR